jgi:hypothetical protein
VVGRKIKKACKQAFLLKGYRIVDGLDALAVFACACIDFNFITLRYKNRHWHFKACSNLGGF